MLLLVSELTQFGLELRDEPVSFSCSIYKVVVLGLKRLYRHLLLANQVLCINDLGLQRENCRLVVLAHGVGEVG